MNTIWKRAVAGIACLTGFALHGGAASCQPLPALSGVEEIYSHTVNVGGFLLVGVRLGTASGPLNLLNLKVVAPFGAVGELCLGSRLETRHIPPDRLSVLPGRHRAYTRSP